MTPTTIIHNRLSFVSTRRTSLTSPRNGTGAIIGGTNTIRNIKTYTTNIKMNKGNKSNNNDNTYNKKKGPKHDEVTLPRSSSENSVIPLIQLVSTCVDACERGCQVIRKVDGKRLKSISDTPQLAKSSLASSTSIGVRYKVQDDPRSALTEADEASQHIIIRCLRSVWGDTLQIVGEEQDEKPKSGDSVDNENIVVENDCTTSTDDKDIDELFHEYGVDSLSDRLVNQFLFSTNSHANSFNARGGNGNAKTEKNKKILNSRVNIKDVVIFIDPLDGTREFVEQRLGNVQCLVGIVYKGKPIAGIIGLPFSSTCPSNDQEINNETLDETLGPDNKSKTLILCGIHFEGSSLLQKASSNSNLFQRGKQTCLVWKDIERTLSEERNQYSDDDIEKQLNVFINDSKKEHINCALEYLQNWTSSNEDKEGDKYITNLNLNVEVAGGCGTKFLKTTFSKLEKNIDAISIMPPSTCSWDTAAPTALLLSMLDKNGIDGKVTDLLGRDLVYTMSNDPEEAKNKFGVLVSCGDVALHCHDIICKNFQNENISELFKTEE